MISLTISNSCFYPYCCWMLLWVFPNIGIHLTSNRFISFFPFTYHNLRSSHDLPVVRVSHSREPPYVFWSNPSLALVLSMGISGSYNRWTVPSFRPSFWAISPEPQPLHRPYIASILGSWVIPIEFSPHVVQLQNRPANTVRTPYGDDSPGGARSTSDVCHLYIHTMWGPRTIAKLGCNYNFTRVYDTQITIVHGVYKPTYTHVYIHNVINIHKHPFGSFTVPRF